MVAPLEMRHLHAQAKPWEALPQSTLLVVLVVYRIARSLALAALAERQMQQQARPTRAARAATTALEAAADLVRSMALAVTTPVVLVLAELLS